MTEIPKGKLIAIGGSEDKADDLEPAALNEQIHRAGVLRRIMSEMRGNTSRVEVITAASTVPFEMEKAYKQAFEKMGCYNVGVMHFEDYSQGSNPTYVERIMMADGVLFTGGDQCKLRDKLEDTPVAMALRKRYFTTNFLLAGTSAGAMAQSLNMIESGNAGDALLKGETQMGRGLGFLTDVIIDTHFVQRGRFGRLLHALANYPDQLGLGLGEDTAVLITKGRYLETLGTSLVVIFDGSEMGHNNISLVPMHQPLSIENIKVHVLGRGYCYDLKERRFIAANVDIDRVVM